ncbi:MAG TPA: CrcB family protein [Anaeromyxobacter sp.]|nr:CrcB family protein [Anaeromyxobacter sp.]
MSQFLLVCAGGAIGAGTRYLVATWAAVRLGTDFPRGTLLVNATGSFLLALVVALRPGVVSADMRLFLGAGILGGYTTYSSFNAETLALLDGGSPWLAAANLTLTVVGCLVAGLAGLAAGRWLAL